MENHPNLARAGGIGPLIQSLRAVEARLRAKIPIIPAGIHYAPGKIWQGYLTFGEVIEYHETINRSELIKELESELKRLSGVAVKTGSTIMPIEM